MGALRDDDRMRGSVPGPEAPAPHRPSDPLGEAMRRLRELLALALPDPGAVAEACADLRKAVRDPPDSSDAARLAGLTEVLHARGDDAARPLHGLLLALTATLADLLGARDADATRKALEFAAAPGGEGGDPVRHLFLRDRDPAIRRLAARILDLDGRPAPPEIARAALGEEAAAFLAPYLDYTRATHRDLQAIAAEAGGAPACLPSLRAAERVCGADTLRRVVAALGWPRLSLGMEARRVAGISVDGSLPRRGAE